MKLFTSLFALCVSATPLLLSAQAVDVTGTWQGFAVRNTVQVPLIIRIWGAGASLHAAFLNGPAEHPEETPASSVTFDGTHLVASFDYFARKIDATVDGTTLTGSYGPARLGAKTATPTPFTLKHVAKANDPAAAPSAPTIAGSWNIQTSSAKGESAWEFRADQIAGSPVIKTVIQRIDGDTGGLWGTWDGTRYTVGHFNAAGPALYGITPQPNGTLLIKNLLAPADQAASEWIAQPAVEAQRKNLPAPTDPTQQTSVKDPRVPFAFRFPDLTGKTVANTDPEFRGKVVIVAIGGSWCPNCHDEAPFLVTLYKKFHARGLEIVGLDFEQGDPETDTARLKAFIAHYAIPYPVLLAGTTDQLAEKVPQGVNLNCWPTSFFLGRDGLVKETHAGFAGPGNTAGHEALQRDVTALIEKLLAEPVGMQSAKLTP